MATYVMSYRHNNIKVNGAVSVMQLVGEFDYKLERFCLCSTLGENKYK